VKVNAAFGERDEYMRLRVRGRSFATAWMATVWCSLRSCSIARCVAKYEPDGSAGRFWSRKGLAVRLLASFTIFMGKDERDLGLLRRLGRAAGLSALATATMASGPCGDCEEAFDECSSIQAFSDLRDTGLAATAPGSGGSTSGSALYRQQLRTTVESWDGASCPTDEQRRAISELNGKQLEPGKPMPSEEAGMCCYHVIPDCPGGRPFLVDGKVRVARLDESALPERLARSGADDALTRGWLGDALTEHASVAAFARLSLQLLALGAPAELVRDAQLASLDELRHAEFCFERASHHAGRRLSPGPLPVQGALDDLSLAGLIESNLREGCIGETLAARRLERQAEHVHDPALRAALLAISEDETRHAELAFRILAWCRAVAPELTREAVAHVLAGSDSPELPAPVQHEGAEYLAERSSRAAAWASDHQAWQRVLSPLLGAVCAA